jgi:hypothetical protein
MLHVSCDTISIKYFGAVTRCILLCNFSRNATQKKTPLKDLFTRCTDFMQLILNTGGRGRRGLVRANRNSP